MLPQVELVSETHSLIQVAQEAKQVSLVKTPRMPQASNQARRHLCLDKLSSQPQQASVELLPCSLVGIHNSRNHLEALYLDRLLLRARQVCSKVKARLLLPLALVEV
jgi:hypothetical protein